MIRSSACIFVFICSFAFVACKEKLAPGHYEGNFLQHVNSDPQAAPETESVKIRVTPLGDQNFHFRILNKDGNSLMSASFHLLRTGKLKIESDFLSQNPILADPVTQAEFTQGEFAPGEFAKDKFRDGRCFRSFFGPQEINREIKINHATSLEFCFKADQFLLEIYDETHSTLVELSGNAFEPEPEFPLEEPISLNLSNAVEIAFRQNFASKIAYQQAYQARFAAMAAYLNLVPHLTTNLIWNAAPNYITYIATLQGLVPFLLPSYWFQAKESSIDKEIKELALIIMRANLVVTVEELTYSLNRDESITLAQQAFLSEIQEFKTTLSQSQMNEESRELLFKVMHYVSEALTSDVGDMTKLVRQDRFSLAQTLGFHNIEAILAIDIDRESLTIDAALPIDPHAMAQLTSERSFEIKQLDDLKKIAKLKKLENYFVWLDPSGDPKQSFGLNTFPQQKQLKSQILELEIERDETKTRIYQNAYKLALDYNEAIQSYGDILKDLEVIHFDLRAILEDAVRGLPVDVETLKWKAQKHSASLIARQMILANFRIARAKKDRFLLSGYFSRVLPRLQGPTTRQLL